MLEWTKAAAYLLSPLTLAMFGWLLAGLFYALHRRRAAVSTAMAAFILLWVCAMPVTDQLLTRWLESGQSALSVDATPAADAIVVLGGAVGSPQPPRRPHLALFPASGRVWHAASLYRAGKARWVVVAAGSDPFERPESEAIATMLVVLGVPRTAIVLDSLSRNTRQNAVNSRRLLESVGAKRVLLVTSAVHMRRAEQTFRRIWADSGLTFTPAVTDVRFARDKYSVDMWLPSPSSLENVTKSLKEYAGLAVLAII